MPVRYGAVELDWLGHATVRVAGRTGTVVYVDPVCPVVDEGDEAGDADLVLVTHSHHYDPEGIRAVAHENAVVLVHEAVGSADDVGSDPPPASLPYDVERVVDDEAFVLGPLDLWTTPAYTDPAGSRVGDDPRPSHPEGDGCGYGLTMDGVTVYVPGHTDAHPFHDDLDVDVCCPPIGGRDGMDADEAAALVSRMRPGLVLPIDYDPTSGTTDSRSFVVEVASDGVPVVLDE